ncbi:hypothetical protein OSC27_13805 [Microbacterium sp. STN6]|uniref:N-acetylglucosamine kinase n=1 Tax=Microbacterium sp. STN6 TaxID=2995588 RepID=UPI002260FC2C|nr:BadF/BadG/BcrA/BcrD ATPase family protein [Microbacterium sp. STN6]MCX7523348.1 hypothetical protein [Microbacterium sp. STN6]
MQHILAIDAGGTHTRAVRADAAGHCLGYGVSGPGNPISAGTEGALASFTEAALQASGGGNVPPFARIVFAMAGHGAGLPLERISASLAAVGIHGPVSVESDLLAMFCSGTPSPDGYALAAGTGSVAARIVGHRLDRVADGTGWLLGDAGSGFWIGRRIARAAVADLDGLGPATALTDLLLAELGLGRTGGRATGRPRELLQLIEALYALRPVQLSRFAPLAFASRADAVAASILRDAAAELAASLRAVREEGVTGPLTIGGSVLSALLDTGALNAEALGAGGAGGGDGGSPIRVRDGAVGAVVLALVRGGVPVDQGVFDRIVADVERLRAP